jgi:integrase
VSPSAYITARATGSGTRYVVRYRLGGRAFPVQHAGSFRTLKEARARRDFVAGEIAAGRDPRVTLARVAARPAAARTLRQAAAAFLASRVDLEPSTLNVVRAHLGRILPALGARDPLTITLNDVQEWVAGQGLAPASLRRYLTTLRQLLDHAGADPNPARDRRLRLPRVVREEARPPDADEVLAILRAVSVKYVLPLIVLEQTGMRVGELVSLAWGDVDVQNMQFRVRAAAAKTRQARWVQVPAWLVPHVERLCPLEDRTPERRVFTGLSEQGVKQAMGRACRDAKIAHYHPHDLRHRRGSLWHGQGVPARYLAERLGHAHASLSLDVYSHVMPLAEVPRNELSALLVRSP